MNEEPSAAQRYDEAIDAIEAPFTAASTYAHRTRRLVWALAASLALDIALTVMFSVALHRVSDLTAAAEQQAAESSDYLIASCVMGNKSRADNRHLWAEILALAAPPPTSPQARNLIKIKALVAKTFADRDCAQVPEPK